MNYFKCLLIKNKEYSFVFEKGIYLSSEDSFKVYKRNRIQESTLVQVSAPFLLRYQRFT